MRFVLTGLILFSLVLEIIQPSTSFVRVPDELGHVAQSAIPFKANPQIAEETKSCYGLFLEGPCYFVLQFAATEEFGYLGLYDQLVLIEKRRPPIS